jgi:predicted pyridoxine 5'-phosphate oxidase superfamily flavin-nucleotide-binding protein
MGYGFLDIAMTPSVKAAQADNGVGDLYTQFRGHRQFDRFTDSEREFLSTRDSFYMATVSETGWPYVQHRGGAPGFIKVLDDTTFACADYRGNRQYISLGNLAVSDKVCVFLMDYPHKRRLKIYAHAQVRNLTDDKDLARRLAVPGYKAVIERAFIFHLDAFDWNCPQHITPRFTQTELAAALEPVKQKIADLERENATLKERLLLAEAKGGRPAPGDPS